MHYGKCRIQQFWSLTHIETKHQDLCASDAFILTIPFWICLLRSPPPQPYGSAPLNHVLACHYNSYLVNNLFWHTSNCAYIVNYCSKTTCNIEHCNICSFWNKADPHESVLSSDPGGAITSLPSLPSLSCQRESQCLQLWGGDEAELSLRSLKDFKKRTPWEWIAGNNDQVNLCPLVSKCDGANIVHVKLPGVLHIILQQDNYCLVSQVKV